MYACVWEFLFIYSHNVNFCGARLFTLICWHLIANSFFSPCVPLSIYYCLYYFYLLVGMCAQRLVKRLKKTHTLVASLFRHVVVIIVYICLCLIFFFNYCVTLHIHILLSTHSLTQYWRCLFIFISKRH